MDKKGSKETKTGQEQPIIEKTVVKFLDDYFGARPKERQKIRCHEAARIIAKRLTAAGIDVLVFDGWAIYSARYLEKILNIYSKIGDCLAWSPKLGGPDDLSKVARFLRKEFREKKKLSYQHSWCVAGVDGELMMIDFHPHMSIYGKNRKKLAGLRWLRMKIISKGRKQTWRSRCAYYGNRAKLKSRMVKVKGPEGEENKSWSYKTRIRIVPELA